MPGININYYDRDSGLFSILLQYLRTGELIINNSDVLIENILIEAKYFKFEKLIKLINKKKQENLVVTKEVKTLSNIGSYLLEGYKIESVIPQENEFIILLKV